MKKIIKDVETRKAIKILTISGCLISLFVALVLNFEAVRDFIKNLFSILSPFIWGVLFAMIALKPANRIENLLPSKWAYKTKRFVASVITTLVLVLFVTIIIVVVAPKLVESVASISIAVASYATNPDTWAGLKNLFHMSNETISSFYQVSNQIIQSGWTFLKNFVPDIFSVTVATISSLLRFVLGFIVCLYILIDRGRISYSLKRVSSVLLDKDKYVKGRSVMYLSFEKFTNFFSGKLLDSLIIGIICFVAMLFINGEYAVLISVIVGVTNIIPFFGPFIGAVPCALILLIVDPLDALIFIIMVIVLQQIDGNIIGPKILGDSMGLSSLWIMFAIIVGGAYFGFFGMLLGVPVFSVIYYLVSKKIDKRLNDNKRHK